MGWFHWLRGKKKPTRQPKRDPRRFVPRLEILEDREVPSATALFVYGASDGNAPLVEVYNAQNQQLLYRFYAFSPTSQFGVNVALGDVNGDGQDDIICGAGRTSQVRVYDGATGQIMRDFFALPNFAPGGVTVAAGDVNDDGKADIIVGAGRGVDPTVAIFDGKTGKEIRSFQAFLGGGFNGVTVAAGDVTGDGRSDIIVGSGPGVAGQINVFNGFNGNLVYNITGLSSNYFGGVTLAVADFNLDGQADIIAGTRSSAILEITVIDGGDGIPVGSFGVSSNVFGSGINLAINDIDGDAVPDLIVSGRKRGVFQAYSGSSFEPIGTVIADSNFRRGIAAIGGTGEQASNQVTSQVVRDWINIALEIFRAENVSDPVASRTLAMMSIAVYDSIASIFGGYETYLIKQGPTERTNARAAAATAAYTVLATLFPNQQSQLEDNLRQSLSQIADTPSKRTGVDWGYNTAVSLINSRTFDNSGNAGTPYTPVAGPGEWQETASGSFVLPGWGSVTPFAISSGSALRPDGPPALLDDEYTIDYHEIQTVGVATGASRTDDQTQAAQFWNDGIGSFSAAGHWSAIAAQITKDRGMSLIQTARTFAILNSAAADATIAAWDAKSNFHFWRPETAIQNADTDGNDNTIQDAAWTPLIASPASPGYVSEQAAIAGASAAVLTALFGDNFAFTATSNNGQTSRSYSSFLQAAQEAAVSRIYAGVDFRFSVVDGLLLGQQAAAAALSTYFQTQ